MEKVQPTPRSLPQLTAYKHFSKMTFKQMSLWGREQNNSFIQLGTFDSFATNYPLKQNEDLLYKMLNTISLGKKLTYQVFGGRNDLVVCGCLVLFCFFFTGEEQQYPLKFSIRQSSGEFFLFPHNYQVYWFCKINQVLQIFP